MTYIYYTEMLLAYNLIGGAGELVVPFTPAISQQGDKYFLTYSLFDAQADLLAGSIYDNQDRKQAVCCL